MSVVNVELPTDGLFFTLGNMMPPFRVVALFVLTLNALVGIVFDWTAALWELLLLVDDVDDDDDDDVWFDDCDVCVTTVLVVVWIGGGSVNSSINEYLRLVKGNIWEKNVILKCVNDKFHLELCLQLWRQQKSNFEFSKFKKQNHKNVD